MVMKRNGFLRCISRESEFVLLQCCGNGRRLCAEYEASLDMEMRA